MAFWSSQKIEANLQRLTDYPNPEMVDCNSLTLRVGPEVYVTPGLEQAAPSSHTKELLGPGAPITIPSGQFAFLLTEETVSLPTDVMGFISVKATYKLKGLVNVSGFHVDPGWSGRLLFTVFNAGPATIHLQQGLPVFLLWIADLNEPSDKHKEGAGPDCIPPGVISNITGVVDSIYALEKRMKTEIKSVAERQEGFRDEVLRLRERQTQILLYFGVAAVFGGALVGAAAKVAADRLFPPSHQSLAEAPLVQPVRPMVEALAPPAPQPPPVEGASEAPSQGPRRGQSPPPQPIHEHVNQP